MPFRDISKLAAIGVALGHKRRILILKTLYENNAFERSFGRLQNKTNIPDASLRHHLGVLIKAGLICRRVVGTRTEYRLTIMDMAEILGILVEKIKKPNSNVPTPHPVWQNLAPHTAMSQEWSRFTNTPKISNISYLGQSP